jgi:hypothetical protein
VKYYLKVNKSAKDAENEVDANKWIEILKNVNLYSLFKTIDDKLVFNQEMLRSLKFTCSFPPL